MSASPLIVALDYPAAAPALALAEQLDPASCRVKVGKELFTREGPAVVRALHQLGFQVFLDLKFHDIPNTTAQAVRAAADLGVWMVNVHCSGGSAMLRACREVLGVPGEGVPLLIGVTVLTSLEAGDLAEVGLVVTPEQQVLRLAALASSTGLDGLVCSAREAAVLKQAHPQLVLVTPGIRPAGSASDDQRRTLTPAEALQAGADYLVMGRPITRAADPAQAVREVLAGLQAVS